MPPPQGTPNPIEGPGDYSTTSVVHNDTYPAIDPTKQNLQGKAVFVAGATRGLGRAISISFAKAGASFIAIGARSDLTATIEEMERSVAALGLPKPKILPLKVDVSDQGSVETAVAQIREEFPRLDILINNAGLFGHPAKIADSDPDEWMQVFEVNLKGPFLLLRNVLPFMLEKGGDKTIASVSSVGAHLTNPTLSAYQISKLALIRLTEFVMSEYGDQEVLAYCIHPGNVPTDMVGGADGLKPELRPIFVETPQLSADTLVFLTAARRPWLGGRYVNVTWDMPELLSQKEDVVKHDKLKVRMVI